MERVGAGRCATPPINATLETPRLREEIRAVPSGGVTSRGKIEKRERRISARRNSRTGEVIRGMAIMELAKFAAVSNFNF